MKSKLNIVLMANDFPGLETCKYLVHSGYKISRLYLHEPNLQKYSDEIIKSSNCQQDQIFLASSLKQKQHVDELLVSQPDFIITVYWAHLLSTRVINAASQDTVNFHPSFLPENRGWYPHVYSLANDMRAGVSLHRIEEKADTGAIWAQKEVSVLPSDTAFSLYDRCQKEIVSLFKQTWPSIVSQTISPVPQKQEHATYNKKQDVANLDFLDLEKTMKVRDLINVLRARSFGNLGFAYFCENEQKTFLNLRLGPSFDFNDESIKKLS